MTLNQLRYLLKFREIERFQMGNAIAKCHVQSHRARVVEIERLLEGVSQAVATIETDCPEISCTGRIKEREAA